MAKTDLSDFQLQPRHTERNFRDMEANFRVILQAYPNSVILALHPYSLQTFRQKFWDALNSYCHPTTYWHSDLSKKKLNALRPMLKLTDWDVPGNAVTVAIRQAAAPGTTFVAPLLDPVISLSEIDGTDKALVWAYATIKSRNRCSDSLTLVGLPVGYVEELHNAFGESILLIPCDNGNYNLI